MSFDEDTGVIKSKAMDVLIQLASIIILLSLCEVYNLSYTSSKHTISFIFEKHKNKYNTSNKTVTIIVMSISQCLLTDVQ